MTNNRFRNFSLEQFTPSDESAEDQLFLSEEEDDSEVYVPFSNKKGTSKKADQQPPATPN